MGEDDLSFWSNISNAPTEDWLNGVTTDNSLYGTQYDLGSGLQDAGGSGTNVGPSIYDVSVGDGSVGGSTGFDLSKIFGNLTGSQLAQLAGGVYGTYAGNQQAQAQQQAANQLLQNADPYKQYRQEAEIPFKLAQMQQYGNMQGTQNQLLQAALQKATATDPSLEAAKAKMTGYNPLSGDYGFYQKQLQQSYTDPMKIYNDQGYQTLANLFGSQIARRDAAAGRLSQYGDRATEMQGNFLKYLNDYRSGLNSAAGTSGGLQSQYANNLLGQYNGISNANLGQLQGLGNLFSQTTSGLNNLANTIAADRTAGNGAAQAAQMQTTGGLYGNYSLNPLLGALTQSFGG